MEQSAPAYALGQSDTRPWGDWRVIDVGPGYVVKRITVRPEQSRPCNAIGIATSIGWS